MAREQTGESFTKLMNDVNRRIFELIHSNENMERLGGIMAIGGFIVWARVLVRFFAIPLCIDALLDFDGEENTTKITRFANYLRNVLPGNDPYLMNLAAKTLGRLALYGGTLTVEFVEFEAKRALEWLQGMSDSRVDC